MISLTTKQKNELKELYKKLYNARGEIENKCRGKQHSIFTCQIGKAYADSEIKFMLIGKCMNGWLYDESETSAIFAARRVEEFITAEGFQWIEEDPSGRQSNGKGYNLETCRFFTYSRTFFEKLTEPAKEQYTRARIWQDYIVQSDLYKISPKSKGNPGAPAQRAQKDICLALLKKEIEILKPTHILFATNVEWLFDEIKGELGKPSGKYNHIKLTGHYLNAKVLVTPHPASARPYGIKKDDYAEECVKAFEELDK